MSSTANQEIPAVMHPSPTLVKVNKDDWWVKHWVGAGKPFGTSSRSSLVPIWMSSSDSDSTTIRSTAGTQGSMPYNTATREGRGSAAAEAAKVKKKLQTLPVTLCNFLNKFEKKGEKVPYYPSKVSSLKERSCTKLKVNFNHLLQEREDFDLAVLVCNYQTVNQSYLNEAVKMFFEDKDLNAKEPDIQFTKMPKSIYRAMDFIKSADRARFVSACGSKILVSTTHGRRAFDVIMSKLLDYLIRGMSWNGELTLDDLIIMVMTNGSLVVVIIPPPVKPENATGAERVSDLHSLWDCMETYYTVQGKLSLYFDQLEKDLKGAKENEVTQHWFYDYLRFHLALFSSTARSNFMCRLHQCYKGFQLALINKYWKVFATWPRAIPKWRSTPFRGTVLRPVYHYPWRNESGLSDDEKWKRDTRQDIIADLLEFVRHSCQHLHEHVTITDLDEIELFGSSTFDSALVYLIRSLLKANLMEDLDRRSGAWSNFKASKSDLRGPPAGSS